MCKIIIFFLIITMAFSSCRPSYMRCPKNRRCVAIPVTKEDSTFQAFVNNSKKELLTCQL